MTRGQSLGPSGPRHAVVYWSLIAKTAMFKSAATNPAQNSTIPALPGNADSRLLQEAIATEKLVLQSCVHDLTSTTLIQIFCFQSSETQRKLWQICRRSAGVGCRRRGRSRGAFTSRPSITATDEGPLGHVLSIHDPITPLGLIAHFFRISHRVRSEMPESRPC